jgi:transcriptional regulator with XRE-family HTH domain
MTETQAGSTVPRRQLGRYLRELRLATGLSVRAAAKELERSEPTMWRVESGQVSMRAIEVEGTCRLYGATEDMTKALIALARETKAKGWWQAYGDVLSESLDLYVGLEAAAARIDWYESELAPGLFQTPEYARALVLAHVPDEADAKVNRRVQLRMERQAILRRPIDPPVLRVLLRESILRCPVGGPAVMSGQLGRLAEASELPNVALRVVPFAAGLQPGMLSGSFEILRFPVNGSGLESEPPTVYADRFTGALYLDKPHEVERYDQSFGVMWDAALDEAASRVEILRAVEELR